MLPTLFKYQILLGQPVSRTECSPAKPFTYTSATLASFQAKKILLPAPIDMITEIFNNVLLPIFQILEIHQILASVKSPEGRSWNDTCYK